MKRKLAACILSLLIGTVVTANANALACSAFNPTIKAACENLCNLISSKIGLQICL
ncbi:hypothetical protein Xedl_03031 [Xenorhabdus eapokensis]|uniref:Uncharacterized protein n=1 Tax=Xenorhabdus eapokensis TaxID=1873482 RepID=A0A1Q5TLM8_9GAMM|nr:hypothetical protein Xedl_03031 [Xenorhabdus eapokensis]